VATWASQSEFDRRFERGPSGIEALGARAFVAIVDVLCFSTSLEAATSQGAAVFPYRWRDRSAPESALSRGAPLADGADPSGVSLSPTSLLGAGTG
jgi:2-phosphosulfolactate phosphatase